MRERPGLGCVLFAWPGIIFCGSGLLMSASDQFAQVISNTRYGAFGEVIHPSASDMAIAAAAHSVSIVSEKVFLGSFAYLAVATLGAIGLSIYDNVQEARRNRRKL